MVRLPALGMYTRLTGRALNGSVVWCTLSASLALASGVSTTSPSTPAVRRPALRSVTRRTLTSVFARERSINFCRLRTFFEVPRLRRREDPLPQPPYVVLDPPPVDWRASRRARPLVRSPRRPWSSRRPTCPRVPGLRSSSPPQAHLTASARFRARAPGPVSGRLSETTAWRSRPSCPGFPSPFGCRRSLLGHPIPAEELGPPCGRLTGRDMRARTPTGLPRSARMSCDRGGCPLYPEDGGAPPGRGVSLTGACRSSAASPYTPLQHSHRRGLRFTRHQRGFTQFTRPVFPSPVAARMERAALRLSPELRTPPTRSRRRTSRWGQAIEHGPGTTRSTSHQSILQSVVHSFRATSRRTTKSSSLDTASASR